MLKVLIADDEPKIRRGIRSILDWNSIGFEIVAEAEDGEVALEEAAKNTPDLILVDICMPFLNGLDLIQKLKSTLNHPVIIIISGHDEFRYAQSALKLQVFDYILKPVDKDGLLNAVMRAKEEIIIRKNKVFEDEFTTRQLKKSKDYLKEAFMQDWLNGKLDKEMIKNQMCYFNIEPTESMGLLVIKFLDKNSLTLENEWDVELLTYAAANIAKEVMEPFKSVHCFKDNKNQIVLLSDILPMTKWQEIGGEIEKYVIEYLKKEIITESEVLDEKMTQLQEVYSELCRRLTEKSHKTPIVITIQKYIEKHYNNPNLSLTEIADSIGISQTYLTRLLKQELGVSFVDFLTQVRIKKALMLMQDPNIKVYEVAELVGYSSQHYFSNVFKKYFNMSPLDYRKGGRK